MPGSDVGWGGEGLAYIQFHWCSVGLRSGLYAEYLSYWTPTLANHVFKDLTFYTGAYNKRFRSYNTIAIQGHLIQLCASNFLATVWERTTHVCNDQMSEPYRDACFICKCFCHFFFFAYSLKV